MIAQIRAKSQFSPEFGQTNPSATRCYLAEKHRDSRPALIGSGVPGENLRPHGHTTSGSGKRNGWIATHLPTQTLIAMLVKIADMIQIGIIFRQLIGIRS
jgi:hypothetical protein